MTQNRQNVFPFSKPPNDPVLRRERTELENAVRFLQGELNRLRDEINASLETSGGSSDSQFSQLATRVTILEGQLAALTILVNNSEYQPQADNLDALSALTPAGLVAHTLPGEFAVRQLAVPSDLLGITNPAGVAGNPTVTLPVRPAGTVFAGPVTGADASPSFRPLYTATQVVYVAKWGNDTNSGLSVDRALLTIGAAITAALALTPSATNRISVSVLDAGTYVEDLTCESYVDINGATASLDGVVTLVDNMTLRMWEIAPSSGSNRQLLRKTAGNTASFAFVDRIDSRNVTSSRCVYNIAANSILFVWCTQMFVGAGNIGVGDSAVLTGHVHLKVPDLYLAGNGAIGIDATDTASTILGYIDHILEVGTPTSTIGINVGATGSVRLVSAQLIADTAYSVTAGGVLHLICSDITGARTGIAEVTGDTASETIEGKVRLATVGEAEDGLADDIAVTPEGLAAAIANIPGAGSDSDAGSGAPLCDVNPQPLGTATPGVSTAASRCDHVHPTATVVTLTLTGNQDDVDISGATIVRLNNASLLTIRGIAGGINGKRVVFVSIGAGIVEFAHQNANSTAANRLINFATVGNTPLAASVGTCEYEYDAVTERWRLIEHEQGAWITPAYAAGNFTGSGTMTWAVESGDIFAYQYWLKGRTLFINYDFENTLPGGTLSGELRFNTFGFTIGNAVTYPTYANGGGEGFRITIAIARSGETYVRIFRNGAFANWVAASANVQGQLFIEIQ